MITPGRSTTPDSGEKTVTYRHVGVQNAVSRLEAGTGFPPKTFKESGANHAYTCWTNEAFDETDPTAILKWVKRVERAENYAAAVTIVCRRLESVLKANRSVGGPSWD